ncbi:MAG: hypothetical protein HY720_09785 [Planctomycetes bacterium]|nr:hypothetical protein [Planctomycetota bacterium]
MERGSNSPSIPRAPGAVLADYRELARSIDQATDKIRARHPRDVHCSAGCSLCCHDFFQVSILEGAAARIGFEGLPRALKRTVRVRVEALDAELVRRGLGLSRRRSPREDDDRASGLVYRAREAVAATPLALCPLNAGGLCAIYPYRPVICRTFGFPIDHFFYGCPCGNFEDPDARYLTLDGQRIDRTLEELASEFVAGTPLAGRVTDNRYMGVVDWFARLTRRPGSMAGRPSFPPGRAPASRIP